MKFGAILTQLLSKYTYRERFIGAILLIYLGLMLPVYWVYELQGDRLSQVERQLEGVVKGRNLLDSYDKIIDDYISWSSHPNDPVTLSINISNLSFDFPLLSSNLESLSQREDYSSKNAYFLTVIDLIETAIRSNAYESHLVLQQNQGLKDLVQGIYFMLPHDNALAAEIYAKSVISSGDKEAQRLFQSSIEHFKQHIMMSKVLLEGAYTAVVGVGGLDESRFELARQSLLNVYRWDSRFIDAALKNFSLEEGMGETEAKLLAQRVIANINVARNEGAALLLDLLRLEQIGYQKARYLFFVPFAIFTVLLVCLIIFRIFSGHFLLISEYISGLLRGDFSEPLYVNPHEELGQFTFRLKTLSNSILRLAFNARVYKKRIQQLLAAVKGELEVRRGQQRVVQRALSGLCTSAHECFLSVQSLADGAGYFAKESKGWITLSDSKTLIGEMPQKIKALEERSTHICKLLSEGNIKVEKTAAMTDLLTHVSEQASLLSLNADLEAISLGCGHTEFVGISHRINSFSSAALSSSASVNTVVRELSMKISNVITSANKCCRTISKGDDYLARVKSGLDAVGMRDEATYQNFQRMSQLMNTQSSVAVNIERLSESLNDLWKRNSAILDDLERSVAEERGLLKSLSDATAKIFSRGDRA